MTTTPRVVKPPKPKVEAVELITTLTTSEDDHFLLVPTTSGHVYILHVPTSSQVCVISAGETSLRQIVFFSNASWFQHVVTVDLDGLVKLWNLRALVSRVRGLIMDIITDKDLIKEEEVKQDLAMYYSHFKERRFDRMFLNGPDISAFYKKPAPSDLFKSVSGLDPALQTPSTWQVTGCFGDCVDIRAMATGTDLSEVLVTATSEGELCRWSLTDGTLVWLRPCPIEGSVEWLRPVYYDQAVCIVTKQAGDAYRTVAILYDGDTKRKTVVQKKVIKCQVGADATTVVCVCGGEKSDVQLVYWDLINGVQKRSVDISQGDSAFKRNASSLTFTNDLSTWAMVVPEEGEVCSLYVWTMTQQPQEDDVKNGTGNDIKEVEMTSTTGSGGRKTPLPDFSRQEARLQFTPTAIGFDSGSVLLLGTSFGLTLYILKDNLKLISVLTAEGIEPLHNQPLSVTGTWSRMVPPHASAVRRLVDMEEHVIVSTCKNTLCVWNLLQKRLMLTVSLGEEEFLHYVISRDSRVLTFVSSSGVLAVWGVREKKQLCSFRLSTKVTAFCMTPDCRRVAALLDDEVTSRVRVFDVRNIDDIRVDDDKNENNNRKLSKESEKSDGGDSEPTLGEENALEK